MPPELVQLVDDLVDAYDKDAHNWRNNRATTMLIGAIAGSLSREIFNQYKEEMQQRIQRGINHRYTRAEFETYPTPVTEHIAENAIHNIQRRIR